MFAKRKEKENMKIKDSQASGLSSVGAIYQDKEAWETTHSEGRNHEFHWDVLN